MLAPAGTPKPIIVKLQSEIVKALKLPDVQQRLEALGFEAVGNTPDEYAQFVRTHIARWAKVIKSANVKVD